MEMKKLIEYIREAQEKKVAIGHFNISNLEGFHAIVNASENLNLPVIIGVSEGERDFIGVREVVALVRVIREEKGFPVFLNADHTYSLDRVKEVVDAGFDSVIYDGAKLSLEENIKIAKECVDYAKSKNPDILVEGELGYIGTSSQIFDEIPEGAAMTDEEMTHPDDAKRYVLESGVDMLAPAVGNIHGMARTGKNPKLHLELIKKISKEARVPLVLHGGSGTSDEDFVNAIEAGMSIIHINTEIRAAFSNALRAYLAENPHETTPYKMMKDPKEAIQKVVESRLKLFNKLS
jgi:fructose-bisphosphate aldolase, class II